MSKIHGNVVGTTSPRADLSQTDETKADFVKGREAFREELEKTLTKVSNALLYPKSK